jgi:hypothetical protein
MVDQNQQLMIFTFRGTDRSTDTSREFCALSYTEKVALEAVRDLYGRFVMDLHMSEFCVAMPGLVIETVTQEDDL